MSDYLWDKTGEPDAEAERLENLLGQLRFQPTPFDLPAELPPAKDFRAARARNILSWPRMAFAASLTLSVLAGAWVVLRQQTGTTGGGQQVATQNNQADAGGKNSAVAAPTATDAANGNNAGEGKKGSETPAAVPSKGSEAQREEQAAARRRPRLPDLADNVTRRTPRAVAPRVNRPESARAPRRRENLTQPDRPARREETAQLAAEREAAEKVLYALRVTSEKLNYARRQVHESGRNEENR